MTVLGLFLIFAGVVLALVGGVPDAAYYLCIPGMILGFIGSVRNNKKKLEQAASRQPSAKDPVYREVPAPHEPPRRRTNADPRGRADEAPQGGKTGWLSFNDIIQGSSDLEDRAKDDYKRRQQERIDKVLGRRS